MIFENSSEHQKVHLLTPVTHFFPQLELILESKIQNFSKITRLSPKIFLLPTKSSNKWRKNANFYFILIFKHWINMAQQKKKIQWNYLLFAHGKISVISIFFCAMFGRISFYYPFPFSMCIHFVVSCLPNKKKKLREKRFNLGKNEEEEEWEINVSQISLKK